MQIKTWYLFGFQIAELIAVTTFRAFRRESAAARLKSGRKNHVWSRLRWFLDAESNGMMFYNAVYHPYIESLYLSDKVEILLILGAIISIFFQILREAPDQ